MPTETPVRTPTTPVTAPETRPWPEVWTDPAEICPDQGDELASPDVSP